MKNCIPKKNCIFKIIFCLIFMFMTWNSTFSKPIILKEFTRVTPEYEHLSILKRPNKYSQLYRCQKYASSI